MSPSPARSTPRRRRRGAQTPRETEGRHHQARQHQRQVGAADDEAEQDQHRRQPRATCNELLRIRLMASPACCGPPLHADHVLDGVAGDGDDTRPVKASDMPASRRRRSAARTSRRPSPPRYRPRQHPASQSGQAPASPPQLGRADGPPRSEKGCWRRNEQQYHGARC